MSEEYWKECISEAFDDAKIFASDEQIELVTSWVVGAHENFSLATGLDVDNANYISDEAKELENLSAQLEKNRRWLAETKPCSVCTTTGLVSDSWGRDTSCYNCNGDGRHK